MNGKKRFHCNKSREYMKVVRWVFMLVLFFLDGIQTSFAQGEADLYRGLRMKSNTGNWQPQ